MFTNDCDVVVRSRASVPVNLGALGGVMPTPAPPPAAPMQQQQQQQPQPLPPPPVAPRFSFHDINVYSVSTLQSHLTVKMEVTVSFTCFVHDKNVLEIETLSEIADEQWLCRHNRDARKESVRLPLTLRSIIAIVWSQRQLA